MNSWALLSGLNRRVLDTRGFRVVLAAVMLSEAAVYADDSRHASLFGCLPSLLLHSGRLYCPHPRAYEVIREQGNPTVLSGDSDEDEARRRRAEEEGRLLGVVRVWVSHRSAGLVSPVVEHYGFSLIPTGLEGVAPAELPGISAQLAPLVHPSVAPFAAAGTSGESTVINPGFLAHDAIEGGLLVWAFIVPGVRSFAAKRRDARRRRALELGLCTRCGYDLRGARVRCPECGAGPRSGRASPERADASAARNQTDEPVGEDDREERQIPREPQRVERQPADARG